MASGQVILSAAKIVNADTERRYVVVSAPGKRFSGDIKVTDLLYECYEAYEKEDKERFENTFSKICLRFMQIEKETGKTVGQYLDNLLWAEAKRRLLLSDASVRAISEELGFCDQFYFSRRFRQLFGVTPSYYRAYGKLEESVSRS